MWRKEALMSATATVIDMLGGAKAIGLKKREEGHLISLLLSGLPYSAFDCLKRKLRLPETELARVVMIQPRTLARRKVELRLQAAESDRVMRIAGILAKAIEVLGSEDNAQRWLRQSNRALGGIAPLNYASTGIGRDRVLSLLAHIEWGDFS
jgi:putative toxin-antitoxin system antitoxin component (TIGR02293 family)